MRALVLRDWWHLAIEERPDPDPGPGEAVLRVTATGICGSDVHGFSGANGRRQPGQVMGHETVGRVEALGPGVEGTPGLVPGAVATVLPVIGCGACDACLAGAAQRCARRRVVGVHPEILSAFAERLVVPVGNVVPLPDSMPEDYGALIEPLAVGFHAARRGGCESTDAVVVIGAGPIGQACFLAAQRMGVERILVTELDPHRSRLAARLGAHVVDPGDGLDDDEVAEALGMRATVVLDAVGSTASVRNALGCVEPGGRVVLVGMNAPDLSVPAYAVSTDERSIVGSFCYSPAEFTETADWVGSAPAELGELVDGRVDLDGAQEAFTQLARGESARSKILVYPHGVPAGEADPT